MGQVYGLDRAVFMVDAGSDFDSGFGKREDRYRRKVVHVGQNV